MKLALSTAFAGLAMLLVYPSDAEMLTFWNQSEFEFTGIAEDYEFSEGMVQALTEHLREGVEVRFAPLQEASPMVGEAVTNLLFGGQAVPREVMYAYTFDQLNYNDINWLRAASIHSNAISDEAALPRIAFGQALTTEPENAGAEFLNNWARGSIEDGALFFTPVKWNHEYGSILDAVDTSLGEDEANVFLGAFGSWVLADAGLERAVSDLHWNVVDSENLVFLSSERLPSSGRPAAAVIVDPAGWPAQ